MKTKRCGILGYGIVNTELVRQLKELGCVISWIARSSGIYDANLGFLAPLETLCTDGRWLDADVVFIGVPSSGNGEETLHRMLYFLGRDIAVVTAEKSALAHHPEHLRKHPKLRYSAMVGGESGMIPAILSERLPILGLCGIVNTTLHFVAQNFRLGIPRDKVFARAAECGLTERGTGNYDTIVESEIRDWMLKGVHLVNLVTKEGMRFREEDVPILSADSFENIVSEFGCIPIVSLRRGERHRLSEETHKPLFVERIGDWTLCLSLDHPNILPFVPPSGMENILLYETAEGLRQPIIGIGAGPATADAMVKDAIDLFRQ